MGNVKTAIQTSGKIAIIVTNPQRVPPCVRSTHKGQNNIDDVINKMQSNACRTHAFDGAALRHVDRSIVEPTFELRQAGMVPRSVAVTFHQVLYDQGRAFLVLLMAD